MKTLDVNVTELRRRLPTYLGKVSRGHRIRVTLHGDVIAEISPPRAPADRVTDALALLKGSVLRYERPLEPAVDLDEWDANR
jgi:antitoxin (DNA-binding transcriptional repressor) of toxin-antitoxin stability system